MFRNKIKLHGPTLGGLLSTSAAWIGLVASRNYFIQLKCADFPNSCQSNEINTIDRTTLTWHNYQHAHASDTLQWISGGIALFTLAVLKKPKHLIPLLYAVIANGILMELVRFLVQRPRPYVYRQMAETAGSVASYTSFYSGHTSFVATTQVFLVWILFHEQLRRMISLPLTITGMGLIVATGLLRVTGGQHFISDVVVGALAGAMVATAVAAKVKLTSKRS